MEIQEVKIKYIPKPLNIFELNQLHYENIEEELSCRSTKDVKDKDVTNKETFDKRVNSGLSCTVCNLNHFTNIKDQREHFKLDWHRFNLNRKLKKLPPVDENKFEELVEDLSSISGSEDEENYSDKLKDLTIDGEKEEEEEEEEEEIMKEGSLIWYRQKDSSEVLGFYKKLVEEQDNKVIDKGILKHKLNEHKQNLWAFIMLGGGHFAAAIFDNFNYDKKNSKPNMILHKTFHKYTVRRKQGGGQSSNDNSKGTAHSAGSYIRRQQEAVLKQDIYDLLTKWKPKLDQCNKIFVRAPSSNYKILYDFDEPVISPKDKRVCKFPITTRRPTLKELTRLYHEFIWVKVGEVTSVTNNTKPKEAIKESKIELPENIVKPKEKKNKEKKKLNKAMNDVDELTMEFLLKEYSNKGMNEKGIVAKEEEEVNDESTEIKPTAKELDEIEKISRWIMNTLPTQKEYNSDNLIELINNNEFIKSNIDYKLTNIKYTPTLFYLVCLNNHGKLVETFLNLFKPDISIVYGPDKLTAYQLCNKSIKLMMRNYRYNNPDAFDYDKGRVAEGITDGELEDKLNNKKEKSKAKKKEKKETIKKEEIIKNNIKELNDKLLSDKKPSYKMLSSNSGPSMGNFGSFGQSKPSKISSSSTGFGFTTTSGVKLGGSASSKVGMPISKEDREKRLKAIEARFKTEEQ